MLICSIYLWDAILFSSFALSWLLSAQEVAKVGEFLCQTMGQGLGLWALPQGTCLHSLRSILMVQDDLLACLWGIGGEINERWGDKVSSKLCRCWLSEILVQPISSTLLNGHGKGTRQNKHVNEVFHIMFVTSVSANGLQICWCEGFVVGCGPVRQHRRVAIMLSKYYFSDKVRKFFNEASSIKNWLWRVAGNGHRRLKDLLFII